MRYSLQYETAKVNNDIISLIEKVKTNDYKDNDFVSLGVVSDKAAKEIKGILGIDVSGYKISIEARQIKHILKDHGEHGLTDHSMAKATDIGKMEYAFTNFDSVIDGGRTEAYFEMKNGHNRTARTVLYEKEIGENSYYVVQAVPETKRKTLFIVSTYIGKKGQKKEAPRLINANSPDATSTTVASATSKDNIPQNSEKSSGNTSHSLSPEDAQAVKHGDYHVTGEDVRFAPVREDIAEKSQNKAQKTQKLSIAPPLRKDIASKNAIDTAHSEDVDAAGDDIADEPVSITTVKERLEYSKKQSNSRYASCSFYISLFSAEHQYNCLLTFR